MQEFDLWDVEDGQAFVVTEPMGDHPDNLTHAVRVKAICEIHAVMMYRRYSLMPDADVSDCPEIDPVYSAAWCEAIKAFSQGKNVNPYKKPHVSNSSWDTCKQYLGWEDGLHYAPLYRTGE
ncbi:hypothetical protein F7Q91_15625 [Vibrio chagasii]|uniref:Uncharacterized protein n=1 Tax=Vibrio chagasii TaxID=170679 RepID=A0A7V7NSG8_9VIBR|nr:hypothetical protein [Vibrio chagasii]KAB0478806.1 hypothetical protein F7Q91_15625 [Vibrio chagasii]